MDVTLYELILLNLTNFYYYYYLLLVVVMLKVVVVKEKSESEILVEVSVQMMNHYDD
jgi:hypothetical protein